MGSPEPAAEELLQSLGAEVSKRPTLEELTEIAAPMLPPGTRLSNLRIVPRYSVGHVYLAASSGMMWLVRPDGYIAWRCERADADRLALFIDRIVPSHA